jgi:gamma-glutamyl:cysteine ligase YbdK (ATP-grasp superfamily)
MAEQKRKLHLFDGFGVEMEYMIVSKNGLNVLPIADKLFKEVTGEFVADVYRGPIAWSNELVSHVIEIKTNGPAATLNGLDKPFHENIQEINRLLAPFDAMLLPGGAHPWMDPFRETVIWPHENNDIYELYNRIFDCRGHGWSNLQSTHINLPFQGDEEFARLHAAIRVLLPIIPALTASSPILDGKLSGFVDTRLETYRHNQEKVPSIAGKVVPEQLFTQAEYDKQIFQRIRGDINSYDTDGILDQYFLNSRGAIARFDRGAIEIRIIDIQECPAADIAVLQVIVALLKELVNETLCSFEEQKSWHEGDLAAIFLGVVKEGGNFTITNRQYLKLFGMEQKAATAARCWEHLVNMSDKDQSNAIVRTIIAQGNLSERMIKHLGGSFGHEDLLGLYEELAGCLENNTMFLPSAKR